MTVLSSASTAICAAAADAADVAAADALLDADDADDPACDADVCAAVMASARVGAIGLTPSLGGPETT